MFGLFLAVEGSGKPESSCRGCIALGTDGSRLSVPVFAGLASPVGITLAAINDHEIRVSGISAIHERINNSHDGKNQGTNQGKV